ncbi:MAG: hypothetical protein IT310_10220 [Anaerolineales bacterium]|nr:hypothetical protein [Anaerolineales bacterium]
MKSKLLIFLLLFLLIALSLACQTVTKAFSPNSGNAPSVPAQNIDAPLAMDWLVTADELNSFSTDVGIVGWSVIKDTPGENRICRSFQGASWSAVPNEGLNCIFKVAEGASLQSMVDSMFNDGQLFAGAEVVNSNVNLEGDSVLYAGQYPNGHAVFDLIFVRGNLMYWSSVTLGTRVGATPQATYQSASQIIDAFLVKIVTVNLDRSK